MRSGAPRATLRSRTCRIGPNLS